MRKIIFNHQKWIRILISFLCISVNSWGQYQGYLGQPIDLPMPTSAPAGYQVVPGSGIYTPASGITSDYIAIRSGTSTAVIIKYTESTLNVNCEYEVVKQYYEGTKLCEDHKTLKTTYTINCLPISISGFPTSEISMEAGEKKSVSIDYSPKYGLSPNFDWETSDDKVVDYDGAGSSIELIAKKEGPAKIKLSSIGGPAQFFTVNVKGTPPNPSSKLSLSANPTGGSVESGTKVYLTASVDGSTVSDADIYYTTDETTPSKSSMKYTSSGISITKACTLKAIAYKDGYETSSVESWSYTISSMSKLTLSANPPGGSVESGTIVYLATSADGTTISGADIYYTTDGTTPSKSSMKYTSSGISITEACTLKAIAYKDGYETSSVGSWSYTISSMSKLTLSANPPGGSVESGTIVYLTALADGSTVSDADIYYTTNGFTPSKSSTKYTSSGVTINQDCTLKAVAYKDGYETSDILTEIYSLNYQNDLPTVTSACAGVGYSMALMSDGTLWGCGNNMSGLFGDESITNSKTFVRLSDNVVSVSARLYHSLILKTDGSLYTCGNNEFYQLGDGTKTNRGTPVKIMEDVASVSAGFSHSLIIKTDGSLWAHGENTLGELGDGTTIDRSYSVKVMDNVVLASAGCEYSLILKSDGSLWACGANNYGQLGDGTTINKTTPVKIMDGVSYVSAGEAWSMIIKKDGSLWACGANNYGQLGDGTKINKTTPVKIMDDVLFVSTSCSWGEAFSMIIKKDGTLWACGQNKSGELGDGTNIDKLSPVLIMSDVASVSAGHSHSVIVKKDGSLWACGNNKNGQLGDGTTSNSNSPVTVISPEPQSITISPTSKRINLGETFVLTYSLTPSYAKTSITVHIDDHVQTTRYGNDEIHVKGIKIGDSEITVETANGLKATCQVTIENPTGNDLKDGDVFIEKTVEGLELTFKVISAKDKTCQVGDGERKAIYVSNDSEITIPESVRGYQVIGIGDKAFYVSGKLTSIIIPEGVVSIGSQAFSSCSRLTSIIIPEGVVSIGENAFRNCRILETITIPSTLNSIEDGAFYNTGLKTIYSYIQSPFAISNTTFSSSIKTNATLWIPNGSSDMYHSTAGWSDFQNIVEMAPTTMEITISSSCYATFYDSQSAYTIPNGLSAQVVTNASNGKLTYRTIAEGAASGVIPKGTAVMIVSDNKRAGTYTLTASDNTATYTGTNLLRGSDEAQMTTGDGYHYKLSYGNSGSSWSNVFGWYWGADNGGSFMTEGHKAWLVVPKSAAITRGYSVDGETTGISTLELSEDAAVYYDLQGRRVTKPTMKGVYIKNGKKVMVK